ncbi:MAG: serine/threonine protein kinase [Pirellulales bacterium]|nr:serine/threonine protein kinase [Pirellulales bacterium]
MSHTFHRYKTGDEPVAGYRLEEHLGAGGFGEVWKALAPGGTEVALKIIDLTGQQGVQEFASLRVVKKVRHPNLISLQAFWMKDESGQIVDEAGQQAIGGGKSSSLDVTMVAPDFNRQTQSAAIAMTAQFSRPVELIIAMQLGSKSLYKRLEECREQSLPGIPVAELLEYLEQAARGIDFLNKPIHDMGKGPVPIVHGDIKPHNILVVGDAAVVCDFGLARAVETLRKTSMAPVTVAYAAPESFKGKVTPTSDQYSLAITYVELRTGRLPFDETMTPYQVMEAHVLRTLDFGRLPEPERLVVERATEAEPEARWASSREMVLALRQAAAATGELALRPGEAAFSGGITPTHAITGRPMARDTDRHTQIKADPHKDTSYPRGHTPAKSLLQDTAHMTPSRVSDGLAETSMLPPGGDMPQAAKKRRGLMVGVLCVAAAALLVGVLLPILRGERLATNTGQTVSSPPGDTGGTSKSSPHDIEVSPTNPHADFIKQVQRHISDRDFNAAAELLRDKAPAKLPAFEKEALQRRLHDGFLAFIGTQLERRAYTRALSELEDVQSGAGISNEEKAQQRERIRETWLAEAQNDFRNEQFSRAIETATNLLKQFPGDRDAQLIVARANVGLPDYNAALTALHQLGKAADLPAEYQQLHTALLLLATGLDSAANLDPIKLLDGLFEHASSQPPAVLPESLELTPWEIGRLDAVRSRTVEQVQGMLGDLPADQAKQLFAKLEKLGGSVELQLFKIKLLLKEKQFDEARQALTNLAAKTPSENADLQQSIAATQCLIDLTDPAAKPDAAERAIRAATKSLDQLSPSLRTELCAAAEALALGSLPATLEPVIQLVGKARDLDSLDRDAATRLARLLVRRMTLRVAEPAPLAKDEAAKFVNDCESVEAAGLASGTTDAFHAECLLTLESRDRQLLKTLVDRAKPVDPYTQLVQARVLRTASQPNWSQIETLLQSAYANPENLPSALAAPFRRAAATRLLLEAGVRKRAPAPTTAAEVFTMPFADAKAADEVFSLLQLARALSRGLETTDLTLSDAQQRELTIDGALAAAWKSHPDGALSRSQSTSLSKWSDVELGADAIPVLLTAFRANEGKTGDPAVAVAAAKRLMEMFQKQFPVADVQGVEFYRQVIQPAQGIADRLVAANKASEIDGFYSAVAEFIGHYKRAVWPFSEKEAEIEKLLSQAIAINPNIPKYFTARGVARVSQRPPNIDGALADAAEAAKLDANLAAAFSLQGHALIYRSRGQSTRDARLADLDRALANTKAAVEKSKPDDNDRAMYLLYTSMARLEKANFESDPLVKRSHLEQAVAVAEEAVALEKDQAYPDYAYTALGNALEDLAWIANVEPEKNYQAAIDAFAAAIESNPASPDPWIGRARCYYKAIADSKLDPKFLQRTTEEAFQSAISDLEQAKQLNAALVEPYLWLGKANQQLGKFAEADAAFATAAGLAEKQHLPEWTIYLFDWTRNAVLNPSLSADVREKLVRERTEKLKSAPSLGGTSNDKQSALLIGESLMAARKTADAIKEYDAALAEYDQPEAARKPLDPAKADGSDVSLLLARALARLSLAGAQWNLAAAQAVINDAARIEQLKPDPKFAALANWYAARARAQSLNSNSPSFTTDFKKQALDPAIAAIRKAIQLAPNDPNSWDWRSTGASLIGIRLSLPATTLPELAPEKIKSLAAEARQWTDDAITMASKRPDLANQLKGLQRKQQDLETSLKAKGL